MNTFRSYLPSVFGQQSPDTKKRQNFITQINSIILNIDYTIQEYSSQENKDSEKVNLLLTPYREYFNDLKTKTEDNNNILNDEDELKNIENKLK